jgi:nucleotide-binding universal stress UspA family protein
MGTITFERILVGIDFGPLSEIALEAAASLADELGARTLHLVHVCNARDAGDAGDADDAGDPGKRLGEYPVPKTKAEITRATRIGVPARELAAEAADSRSDLVVVASHDRGDTSRAVVGSVASTLIRVAPCPVWIVGKDRPGTQPIRRVLAAIDMSRISTRVLREAARVAKATYAELTVLSLYEGPKPDCLESAYQRKVDALVDEIREPGLEVSVTVMRKAPPANAIRDVAEILPADLIVIGTSGHNAWQRLFLGSTATRVAINSPCPVLCVPNPT